MLSARSLTAEAFRKCFLPNDSSLISSLCGNASSPLAHDGWAAEFCSKVLIQDFSLDSTCNFTDWTEEQFTNWTVLEVCRDVRGLVDYLCNNITLLAKLGPGVPPDYCDSYPESKCVLQQLFDMLPAPYHFESYRLCVDPVSILREALYQMRYCEGVVDERVGWLATVGYVLQVLDFVVGLSAGPDEGEQEVRRGLGQAILLTGLLNNASFWTTLRSNASLSVLQTVGVYLRQEKNPSLKEDLLGCFSVCTIFICFYLLHFVMLPPSSQVRTRTSLWVLINSMWSMWT